MSEFCHVVRYWRVLKPMLCTAFKVQSGVPRGANPSQLVRPCEAASVVSMLGQGQGMLGLRPRVSGSTPGMGLTDPQSRGNNLHR